MPVDLPRGWIFILNDSAILNQKPYSSGDVAARLAILACLALCLMFLAACGSTSQSTKPSASRPSATYLSAVGYTVQVGAFKEERNSINFANKLNKAGVDAYHFLDTDGLFKVRFGSFENRGKALTAAEALQKKGLIEEFWVTMPKALLNTPAEKAAMRNSIINVAKRFEGTPYKWGGTSAATGFDCSGYTMTVYRLNGLQMPRTAREQFAKGYSINLNQLQKGDLVFFDTMNKGYASHVGIYIGNGIFIHAPRTGKNIEEADLYSDYYKKRYLGARAYF